MVLIHLIDWFRYTDGLKDIDPDQVCCNSVTWLVALGSNLPNFVPFDEQAEEMFDAASRYLLFPLKRAVADVLLQHLEMVSPAELCHWLILSDMYAAIVCSSLSILLVFLFSIFYGFLKQICLALGKLLINLWVVDHIFLRLLSPTSQNPSSKFKHRYAIGLLTLE